MRLTKVVMAGFGAVALVAVSSGTAFAGEITGNGKPTQGPAHSNSICSFSGQNDTPDADFPEGGRVQSYGQLVKAGLKGSPDVPSPGVACNGHTGFFSGGGDPEG
jgi:hypothetical protein